MTTATIIWNYHLPLCSHSTLTHESFSEKYCVNVAIKCASKINSMSLNADPFIIFFLSPSCSLICFLLPDNFLLIQSIFFYFCLFSFPLCFLFLGKVFYFVLVFTGYYVSFFLLVPPLPPFSCPVITSLYVAVVI